MQDTSETPVSPFAALVKAQGEFLPITKNRDGQDGNRTFKYADLDELIQKTRPALVANGLAVMQPIVKTDSGHALITKLIHVSGAVVEESLMELGDRFDKIQTYGKTITFLRRYAYQAILCISADDDLDNGHEPREQEGDEPKQAEPTTYSQEQFDENLPSWTAAVKAKKTTPARIIAMVQSKAPLTEEQRKTIEALAPAKPEARA